MDIHRCRFVPYQPQSINALAFSHVHSKHRSPTELRLAVGRENGDIELWHPGSGNWIQEKILRGSKERTIEQLAWTQDLVVDEDNAEKPIEGGQLRLFSSGGSTAITEWDISTGSQKRHAEGNSGDIWCFAAQPQWRTSLKYQSLNQVAAAPNQMLAAGCSDGTIVLFSTADDSLQFLRILVPAPGKKSKVISLTWRDRKTVIAGYENSLIRVIDVEKRTVVRNMSLGKSTDGGNVLVWCVKALPDGTIVSGDSTGELKVWDAVNYSLVQRLKTHEADILDIAMSAKGDLLFTTGVDRRTVVYQPLVLARGTRKDRWQQVLHRRYHQHDVKALAAFESKEMSVLVSGGIDTVPVVMPLRNFDTEYHRSLPHLPQKPQMSCSSTTRLMLTWWDRDLFIWDLPRRNTDSAEHSSLPPTSYAHKLLARIQLSGDESITSAHLSADGQMIVAATSVSVKLFQIRKRISYGEVEIRTRPIDLPSGIAHFGATHVGFSPNNAWLCAVRSTNIIALVKITTPTSPKDRPDIHGRVIKLSRRTKKGNAGKLGNYRQSINCITFSSDGRILCSGDLLGNVDVWILEGHEILEPHQISETGSGQSKPILRPHSESDNDSDSDSESDDDSDTAVVHGQRWIRTPSGSQLPQLDAAIISLSFKPNALAPMREPVGLHATRHNPHPELHERPLPANLIAITSTHSIVEFDVLASRLTDWSRRNPSTCLPTQFTQLKDRVMGVFWDCVGSQERLYLYGSGFLFMLDMSQDLSVADAQEKLGKLGKYDVRGAPPAASRGDAANTDSGSQTPASGLNTRKRKRNTGAGDAMNGVQWQRTNIPSSRANPAANFVTSRRSDVDTGLLSPATSEDENTADDEDVDFDLHNSSLALLRRQNHPASGQTGSSASAQHERQDQTAGEADLAASRPKTGMPYFSTFRYRSIFGAAVLGHLSSTQDDDKADGSGEQKAKHEVLASAPAAAAAAVMSGGHAIPHDGAVHHRQGLTKSAEVTGLEVVIVERPLYDVDLPPRFEGGQDWGS